MSAASVEGEFRVRELQRGVSAIQAAGESAARGGFGADGRGRCREAGERQSCGVTWTRESGDEGTEAVERGVREAQVSVGAHRGVKPVHVEVWEVH